MIARLLVEKILLLYIKYKIASCDKFTLNYFIFSFGPTLNNYSSFGPTLTLTFLLPERNALTCFSFYDYEVERIRILYL